MEDLATNILILGKTGVGKSSLLNYLFGDVVARCGAGKPVTGTGIHRYDSFQHENARIVIYDSWGLEPDKADEWKDIIYDEVRKNEERDVRDWFHTIVYCIDTQRSRIDDFEVNDILAPLLESGNRVMFALTKSDIASDEKRKAVYDKLKASFPDCLQVNVGSVSVKLRSGRQTQQFGREETLRMIIFNFRDNLLHKLRKRIEREFSEDLTEQREAVLEVFEEKAGPLGVFTVYGQDFRDEMAMQAKRRFAWICEQHAVKIAKFLKDVDNMSKGFAVPGANFGLLGFSGVLDCFSDRAFGDWRNDFDDFFNGLCHLMSRKEHARENLVRFLNEAVRNIESRLHVLLDDIMRKEACAREEYRDSLSTQVCDG